MRHHLYNQNFQFVKEPIEFNKNTERSILQYCLGGTLYMPGTKIILDKILQKSLTDITSMVMCFEDSIQEDDLPQAEENVLFHLDSIATAIEQAAITIDDVPLLFLRVRNIEQFKSFAQRLTTQQTSVLSGFTFPKFDSYSAGDFLKTLEHLCLQHNAILYGMPILE